MRIERRSHVYCAFPSAVNRRAASSVLRSVSELEKAGRFSVRTQIDIYELMCYFIESKQAHKGDYQMNQRVLYRFKIEHSQLVRSLRKHCCRISGIWVECEFDNVSHIPPWGARVSGGGFELRVFDIQFYMNKDSNFGDQHSVLVECVMTELADWDSRKKGENPIIPRKTLVSKRNLHYAKILGWTVKGIDQELIS